MPARRPSNRRASQGTLRQGTLVALLVAGLAAAVAGWSWWDVHRPRQLPAEGFFVRVSAGDTFGAVAAELVEQGFASSAWNLKLWGKMFGTDRALRPGDYWFHAPLSPRELFAELASGRRGQQVFLIREGDTLVDVARRFQELRFGGSDVFYCAARSAAVVARVRQPATGLEGYLFPDTYSFVWSDPPEAIVRTMVERFLERTRDLHAERERLGLSVHEMVTLASIIEKETAVPEERPLVAAVFHNRLRAGMKLQADPTATYGKERAGPPLRADLQSPHAYNTYQHYGLPPGPICNPGRAALEAAVRPAAVDYLYFVARGDGTHVFARSLEEHNRNVARWRGKPSRNASE